MKRVENKVAVITGATSGIGRPTAVAFAKAGLRVVIGDIREQPLNDDASTADLIREAGDKALFVKTDVSKKIPKWKP